MGGVLLKPQTTAQVLRCLSLGRYTAAVEGDELRIRGPQPLAGPLPASIKANRDELIAFLNEWAGGAWPPAPGSELRKVQQSKDWSLARVLDAVEAALKRHAA
jgi:hypothetical protein